MKKLQDRTVEDIFCGGHHSWFLLNYDKPLDEEYTTGDYVTYKYKESEPEMPEFVKKKKMKKKIKISTKPQRSHFEPYR